MQKQKSMHANLDKTSQGIISFSAVTSSNLDTVALLNFKVRLTKITVVMDIPLFVEVDKAGVPWVIFCTLMYFCNKGGKGK